MSQVALPPLPTSGPDEWRLPDAVEGQPFKRFTWTGSEWARETPGSRKVFGELGLAPGDLTVYGSFPADPAHEPYVGVMVYRANWTDVARALAAFARIFSAPESEWEETTLGTRQVRRGTSAEFGPMGTTYLWIDARALYQVVCPDEAYAARVADAITPFTDDGDR